MGKKKREIMDLRIFTAFENKKKKKRKLILGILEELRLEAELDAAKCEAKMRKLQANHDYNTEISHLNSQANNAIRRDFSQFRNAIEEMVAQADEAQEKRIAAVHQIEVDFDEKRRSIYESHGIKI